MASAPSHIHELARGVEGWLSDAEGDLLYRLARECRTGCIVEIGSFQGKSTTFLASGSEAGSRVPVYAIDPHRHAVGPQGHYPAFVRQVERTGLTHLVHPLISTSGAAAPSFQEPIELLFIDGAHDLASVQQDWELWVPKVIPGGYVAMHDTLVFPGPREIADARLLASDDFWSRGVADSIAFGRKRRAEDPADSSVQRIKVRTLKRICNVAAQMQVPAFLKVPGSRALAALQRK